jgi:superfamily II DNA/RNA helicase
MLVATDVAARGIDVDNITHVVNYQLLTKLKRTITVLVVLDVQEN